MEACEDTTGNGGEHVGVRRHVEDSLNVDAKA